MLRISKKNLKKKVLGSRSFQRRVRLSRKADKSLDGADIIRWVQKVFPRSLFHEISYGQRQAYEWAGEITSTYTPEPFALILPRGGGKTTTLDLIICYLLAHDIRKFFLIMSSKLDLSKARVRSIRKLLESKEFRKYHPIAGEPAITITGSTESWSNSALINEKRQIVLAGSMEADSRGLNIDAGQRPDFLCLDDVDKPEDSTSMTVKKENYITRTLGQTSGNKVNSAVVFIQNLIRPNGVMDRLRTRQAPYLTNRRMVGPIPAIQNFEYEKYNEEYEVDKALVIKQRVRITGGTPTWLGQDIPKCQQLIVEWGIHSFLLEQQHSLLDFSGAMLSSKHFISTHEKFDIKSLKSIAIGVDPGGGATMHGIEAVGLLPGNQLLQIEDKSIRSSAEEGGDWSDAAVRLADILWKKYKVMVTIILEGNFGGSNLPQLARLSIEKLIRSKEISYRPPIQMVTASEDKRSRASSTAKFHRDRDFFYLGSPDRFSDLRTEWTTWNPEETKESPNRVDAQAHAVRFLVPAKVKNLPKPKSMKRGFSRFVP